MRGTIKWYSEAKRFGWITAQGGEEVYVHASAVRFDGRDSPEAGDAVVFEVVQGPAGQQAIRVRRPTDEGPR